MGPKTLVIKAPIVALDFWVFSPGFGFGFGFDSLGSWGQGGLKGRSSGKQVHQWRTRVEMRSEGWVKSALRFEAGS